MSSRRSVVPPFHGIIPARFGSTRFPGKPLADIDGKPMLWHVFSRAARCEILSSVTVATDDYRIAEAAAGYDIPIVMTRTDHESGTDRVKEAADTLGFPEDAVIVNIQGDEPLLDPRMLYDVTGLFANPEIVVGTLAHRLDGDSAQNPDRVKVVFSNEGEALYFSRAPIPWDRDGRNGKAGENDSPYYGHVGIYAFRKSVLDRFVSLPPGRLEHIEKLEQLRLLENGIKIHVAITDYQNISVDRPEDLLEVIRILRKAD